jgi:hypothetical protein
MVIQFSKNQGEIKGSFIEIDAGCVGFWGTASSDKPELAVAAVQC